MTDTDVGVGSAALETVTPTTTPKPTTADDLLAMYDEEIESTPEVKGEEKTKNEPQAAPKAAEETPEEAAPIPEDKGNTITARVGDESIEIPSDATLAVEVDGKQVDVTQGKLIEAFQKQEEFNRNIDKRLTFVGRKEQTINNAFNNLLAQANRIQNFASKGDLLSINREFAKIAANGSDLDIVQWERKFFDQNKEFFKAYSALTPEQLDRFFLEREAQLNKEQLTKVKERETYQASQAQLQQEVATLVSQNSTTQEEFWDTYKVIVDHRVGPNNDFKTAHEIKPTDVIDQLHLNRAYAKVYEAAQAVGIDNEDVLDDLALKSKDMQHLTVEDLKKVLEMSGLKKGNRQAVENLNRRIQKSGIKPKSGNSTKRTEEIPDGYDRDTLNELYRNQPKTYKRLNFGR